RIARDLHDRLGQWLTYISLELERIMSIQAEPSPDLAALYDDVQTAIEELRETLRQLRAGVTPDAPFASVGAHLVERFSTRTGISSSFHVDAEEPPLGVRVENEVLRILQEALNNVEKHARATHVDITWAIEDRVGTLTITDNGTGFDPSTGVRESAYGLVGMRERAEVIDAKLGVKSAPGDGTTIQLVTAREETPA
ncbi:MAG: sensor histidine kinase, partial [Acidimicrobiales bacterium]|nr:sensor histidine kinase [Acidimicrobiales bacterium]